jgi:hypothetical protein
VFKHHGMLVGLGTAKHHCALYLMSTSCSSPAPDLAKYGLGRGQCASSGEAARCPGQEAGEWQSQNKPSAELMQAPAGCNPIVIDRPGCGSLMRRCGHCVHRPVERIH